MVSGAASKSGVKENAGGGCFGFLLEEALADDFVTSTLPELDASHRRAGAFAACRDSMASILLPMNSADADGFDENAAYERAAQAGRGTAKELRGMARTNACRCRSAKAFIVLDLFFNV